MESAQTALSVAGFYARKLVQPFPLNFGIVDVPDAYWLGGCLLLLLSVFLLRRLSWPGCFLLTAMSLGSVALLVALGDISWTPVAERYMYSPAAMTVIGCTLLSAEALQKSGRERWLTVVRWGLPLLFLMAATGVLLRGFVWQDNLSLFSDTVAKSPGFALAQNELAQALWRRGHKEKALEIAGSIDVPDSQEVSLNKVLVYIEEGRLEEARAFLLDKLQATNSGAYRTATLKWLDKVLGMMRDQCNDSAQGLNYDKERIIYLRQLLRNTGDPFYHYRIGFLQMALGDYAEAHESFAAAHDLLPEDSIYKLPAGRLAEKNLGP
jgi:tetratricopeptide (TPR) repeat protein